MHIVIVGGGMVGTYLATVLLNRGHEVAIIETDRANADELSARLTGEYLVINSDGCDSRAQEDAGIRHTDVFVAATGKDDNNLVACEIAKRVFNVQRVIARVNNPKNMRIFHKVGIECVSATDVIVNMIEVEALEGSMSATSSLLHGNVVLAEIPITHMRHHSREKGVEIDSVPLPDDALIVAVATSDDVVVASDNLTLYPGDRVIVAAESSVLDEARAVLRAL